jgi:prepilin-type N-terminal cleavage/methylation domain-containing protein
MAERIGASSRPRRRATTDEGFSLVELIVAMGIFSVFIVLFLSAVIGLSRGTSQVKLTAESASSALIVFQNFDRQVRYADAVNFPGNGTGGARYIEFRTPAASSPTGITLCTQWRFVAADGLLESRQWDDVPGAVKSPWAAKITTAIATAGPDYPFEMVPATANGTTKQQLVLTIDAGDTALQAGASIATTFVARNSSTGSPSNIDVNGDKVSDTPVCAPSGYRP